MVRLCPCGGCRALAEREDEPGHSAWLDDLEAEAVAAIRKAARPEWATVAEWIERERLTE
jgi:hypothetical protein